MAPYHIRKYQESDRPEVMELFCAGMTEQIAPTFRHVLRLPRNIVLLLGGPLALFLVSGSWLLALMASLILLSVLRFFAKYPWTEYIHLALNNDLSDITKTYLSEPGACFWVAESEERVVGMVGCLPVKEPASGRKQLELFHLSVALKHRGQGMAKALVRTVVQFARDQGYGEVTLSTSVLQGSALGVYQSVGFQKVYEYFYSLRCRINAVPTVRFIYHLPSARVCESPEQRRGPCSGSSCVHQAKVNPTS